MERSHGPRRPADLTLLDDPRELARLGGWTEDVYRDLGASDGAGLPERAFDAKYLAKRAILVLDTVGFTESTIRGGAVASFRRILDMQRVCVPALSRARLVRAFADDLVALFDACADALDAALEIHARVRSLSEHEGDHPRPPECAIGLGFGDVYEIGPNLAMGDEMNRASVLGEDTARGGETLLTEGAVAALGERRDVSFEPVHADDALFPYFRAAPRE